MTSDDRAKYLDGLAGRRRSNKERRWMSAHLRFLSDNDEEWSGSFLVDRPTEVLAAFELALDAEVVILAAAYVESDLARYTVIIGCRVATIAICACEAVPPTQEQEVLVRGADGFERRDYWSLFDLIDCL